jgi:hypothetical protein
MITFQSSIHPRMLEIQRARAEIADNARFDKAFIIMNAFSAVIASYALWPTVCPFSLEGEGWDEGEYNQLILFSSPPLSSRRGRLAMLQPIVFIV